jgi:hypothetical protein
MESKNAFSLGPATEAQIAEVDGMTLEAVRRLLFDCMTALPEGKLNAKEGEALTRAAEKRITAIRTQHMAIARLVSEIAKRQTQRMQGIMEDPMICDAYEASLAPT